MNIRLTFIVPFYNTGKYIVDCLESIFQQNIPESSYEVICVNDFSNDNTRSYVTDLQKSHKNLFLLDHDCNKQQGAARNTALLKAQGRFIWFVDSDDYIKSNVLLTLLSILEKNNLEILHFNSLRFDNDGMYYKYKYYSLNTKVLTGISFLKDYVNEFKCISTESCFKIYKKSFLLENGILFPEGVYFEDAIHSLKALLVSERIQYLTDEIYFYRIHQNSTMRSNLLSPMKLADWINFSLLSINILNSLKRKEPVLYVQLLNLYIYYVIDTRRKIFNLSANERKIFYARLSTLNIKKAYLGYYYKYPAKTLNAILAEVLVLIKKELPALWKVLKSIKSKLVKQSSNSGIRQ